MVVFRRQIIRDKNLFRLFFFTCTRFGLKPEVVLALISLTYFRPATATIYVRARMLAHAHAQISQKQLENELHNAANNAHLKCNPFIFNDAILNI